MSPGTERSYECLAAWYDLFMDHVDYERWLKYIHKCAEKAGSPLQNILELAAGTGILRDHWTHYDRGDWVLSDLSPQMLRRGSGPGRVGADMRALPFKNDCFEWVLCLYDSMNYILSKEDISRVLQEVKKVLKPGGHFLFDVCTMRNSRLYFMDEVFYEELPDVDIVRESWLDGVLQWNQFTFYLKEKGKIRKKIRESHCQRIYTIEELKVLLQKDFELVGVFNGFTFKEGTEKNNRIHFLARKK